MDGYRVIFSLAEHNSGILESELLVADTMDGAPLAAKQGPIRLVAPHEKRPARWVRLLKSITVVHAANSESARSRPGSSEGKDKACRKRPQICGRKADR
jgi:hypothetical protein